MTVHSSTEHVMSELMEEQSDVVERDVSECNQSSTDTRHVAPATTCISHKTCDIASTSTDKNFVDVLVIGNGPSGISLSYLLSGNWPTWNGRPHPDPYLTQRLQSQPDIPIVLQDMEYLSAGLEGRSNNPVSLLFDALQRPGADGDQHPVNSLLNWQFEPDRRIDHLVLGGGLPGGSWQKMSSSVQTLSLCRWMELPNMSFKHWLADTKRAPCGERAVVSDIRDYYSDYVVKQKLEKNFRSYHYVTSVERLEHQSDPNTAIDTESGECESPTCSKRDKPVWEVRGVVSEPSSPVRDFCLRCSSLVLAVGGSDHPNKLNVSGEELDFVHHHLDNLTELTLGKEATEPVLVVGAGLSAADCVLYLMSIGWPVVHSFRSDAAKCVLSRLPEQVYPEYRKVLALMQGDLCDDLYTPKPFSKLSQIGEGGQVTLCSVDATDCCSLQAKYVFILVGARPNLSFMSQEGRELGVVPDYEIDSNTNPIDCDPFTLEVAREPGLYATGALVGDKFVRFAQAAALGVCADLLSKRNDDKMRKCAHITSNSNSCNELHCPCCACVVCTPEKCCFANCC